MNTWLKTLHRIQVFLLYIYFYLEFLRKKEKSRRVNWIVGPNEIAGITRSISLAVPNSRAMDIVPNRFFVEHKKNNSKPPRLWQTPAILARLAHESKGFVYVGNSGYLISDTDERRAEFRFLKSRNKKLVTVLVGSDIRSVLAMQSETVESGVESIADYIALQNPKLASLEHEATIRQRCDVINEYSDQIFSVPRDQKSYLREDAMPIQIFLPQSVFSEAEGKFRSIEIPRILHAPSSPFIKGTPLVRAAIARLRKEGFKFDYLEFSNSNNQDLLEEIRQSHIVLNEFYAFVPGMLGIEALANKCVLLTRASKDLEPTLPGNPEEAWIPTEPYEIYDKLNILLRNPEKWLDQARRGYDWALHFAAENSQGKEFARTIGKLI